MKKILVMIFLNISLIANTIEEIQTMQASFTQTIVNSSNTKIEYNGEIYIKQPALILWKYSNPMKNVFINYTQVTIIEPDLEQAVVTTLEKEINILNMIKRAKKINDNIYEAVLQDRIYRLNIKNNIIEKIYYEDELENKVTISFFDQKINKNIDNNTFYVNIPEDFDIIRK